MDEKIDSVEKFLELQDKGELFEIWNLVFTQFNKNEDGVYEALEYKNIDTGMGLERLAIITQGVSNVFETDLLKSIVDSVKNMASALCRDDQLDYSSKVIADHSRSITFLICDGVIPSNEGRGYVLRRLMRRSIRHAKLIGIDGKFLNDIVCRVIDKYKIVILS